MKAFIFLVLAVVVFGVYHFKFSAKNTPHTNWGSNYTQVLQRAQDEDKPILLLFTGSDWCPWCMKMQQDVLGTAHFANYAKQNLVYVTVDFPRSSITLTGGNTQNERLRDLYHVQGFPTLLLVDKDGRELWRNSGYMQGGPTRLVDKLNTLYNPGLVMVTYHGSDLDSSDDSTSVPTIKSAARR